MGAHPHGRIHLLFCSGFFQQGQNRFCTPVWVLSWHSTFRCNLPPACIYSPVDQKTSFTACCCTGNANRPVIAIFRQVGHAVMRIKGCSMDARMSVTTLLKRNGVKTVSAKKRFHGYVQTVNQRQDRNLRGYFPDPAQSKRLRNRAFIFAGILFRVFHWQQPLL